MSKINRALYGPSMSEVIFGATLSVALGVVIGIAYLVFKPVVTVKEIPKDAPVDAVYYIPGSRSGVNTSMLNSKRKIFASGVSLTITEDELNAFARMEKPPAPTKPKLAPGAKDTAPVQAEFYTVDTPNFRIRAGEMQVVVPVKVAFFGLVERDVLVQTSGPFVKRGEGIAYDPAKLWIGSCPAGRLPGVTGLVIRKFLLAKPLPEDIAAAWAKLSDAAIVGTSLKLMMAAPAAP